MFYIPTAKLPDLKIIDAYWTPAKPKVGDHVIFHATVKNVGAGPTPEGTVTGVAFAIGAGNPMFWSDTYKQAIRPGQTVTLTANGGAAGVPYWEATGGGDLLDFFACVNDARRFKEVSWLNNPMIKRLIVRGGGPRPSTMKSGKPDLVVDDFTWFPARPHYGEKVTFRVKIRNQGPVAVPNGVPFGVGFYTNYCDQAVAFPKTITTGLAPGASLTLVTSDGAFGFPWLAFPGRHEIDAVVNDLAKVQEADFDNNRRRKVMEVFDPRSLILARLKHRYRVLRGEVFGDQLPAESPWTRRDRAFDGSEDTGPISMSLAPVPLGMDLGTRGGVVKEIAFYPKPYQEKAMLGGRFQGSNESADRGYVDLAVLNKVPQMGWNFLPLKATKRYRFLRYLSPAKAQGQVHEIVFLGR